MSVHVLRNFLYLDTQLVDDYLAALEGAVYEEVVVEKEERVGGGELGGSIGPIKGAGKKETLSGVEVTKQVRMTDAAKFQKLYSFLESEEAFGYHEVISEEVWEGFRRNTLLEGIVSIRFSKMDEMVGVVDKMTSLAEIVETFTGKALVDKESADMMKGFKTLDKLQQTKGLPSVLTFTGSPEYKLTSYLNPDYFRVPREQMIGEVTIFCKIQRKLAKGEKFELVELLPNLKDLPLNREQRRKMPKNTTAPPELKDTVKGPAAVVIPIAIYR